MGDREEGKEKKAKREKKAKTDKKAKKEPAAAKHAEPAASAEERSASKALKEKSGSTGVSKKSTQSWLWLPLEGQPGIEYQDRTRKGGASAGNTDRYYRCGDETFRSLAEVERNVAEIGGEKKEAKKRRKDRETEEEADG